MATQPTSAHASTTSLSQRLRDLGRLKRKNENIEEGFEVVHTPDRPSKLISPIEAPTEEECGDEIARWQRTSTKARSMFTRGQYGRADMQDGAAAATERDDDADEHARHHNATDLVRGRAAVGRGGVCGQQQQPALHHHDRPLVPVTQTQEGPPVFARQEQQEQTPAVGAQPGSDRADYAMFPAVPAPLFSGTPRSAPTSHPRSVSPALATVVGDNSLARARYTGARIDIFRHGSCPFCRKFFGNNPLPLFCPYPDCKRDLRRCLEFPNRREVEKAPPRLAQRALFYAQPGADARTTMDQGTTTRQPVPSLTVEAPTPVDDRLSARLGARPPPPPPPSVSARRQRSPSPYRELRTIYPTPLGFYNPGQPNQPPTPKRQRYTDKPLPPPPIPPARSERRPPPPPPPLSPSTSLSESISTRHQQLYRPSQQQHISSQIMKPSPLTTKPPSSRSHSYTPPATPSPSSSNATNSIDNSSRSSSTRTNNNTPSAASSPSHAPGDRAPASKYHMVHAQQHQELQIHGRSQPQQHSKSPSSTSTATATTFSSSSSSTSFGKGPGSRWTATTTATTRSTRPRSSTTTVDDREFLVAWKTPREVAQFERERRDMGDDADLFMDIIGEYGDGHGSKGLV
ncbi:hypothetical protein N658DRAFT_192000 [Parathielavia hyrcaniae]|uniref:Uncharacterized protein n=1 Tax=Parathielavia hyrcaniae TaxID=113614 RepID=A0AAN6Q7C3_9PEZI|nr:hypothetical protein N658DRAFT_192000 [Parathielavia hyrcaniae]